MTDRNDEAARISRDAEYYDLPLTFKGHSRRCVRAGTGLAVAPFLCASDCPTNPGGRAMLEEMQPADPRDAILDEMRAMVAEMRQLVRDIKRAVQTDGDAAVELLARDGS